MRTIQEMKIKFNKEIKYQRKHKLNQDMKNLGNLIWSSVESLTNRMDLIEDRILGSEHKTGELYHQIKQQMQWIEEVWNPIKTPNL